MDRLDDLQDSLVASVVRVAGDEKSVLYQFTLSAVDSAVLRRAGTGAAAAGRVLVTGRAAIAFNAGNLK